MQSILSIAADLSWPFAITLAWVIGEFGHRWTGLPRISFYGVIGFVLAQAQVGVLPQTGSGPMLILADVAFGLILFELGYRINLRWLLNNPWIAVAGLVEALGTFAVVYFIAIEFKVSPMTALLLASLAMSTSPATVMRVVNEERSSGQVTERMIHLTALNCVLAVFTFNIIVGFWMFHSSGDLMEATASSFTVLLASAGIGAVFGIIVPAMLRRLGNMAQDATVAFALSVMLLVALTYTTSLSPLLATLTFGLVARHRRVAFSQAQRNFGALGELLTVLLFVFAASTLEWASVTAGAGLALAVIAGRFVTKTVGVAAFSHVSGISWRKGILTGVSLTPVSVFVILLLEHARHRGINFADELNALAAVTLMLEVFGPLIVQRVLKFAKETHHVEER
ncbi:cation:proton antiporter [Janthinobacterium agaricidamnosum]|uniref:Sodium/hydrogen exchanger family protein n=1 Tax=Janthinobacterium agaricidamnosum NBRC 102515 = DSM 9628 TaxID=1349767 RepID=W0V257_9BURK|nr:cation:proton antiporter [Janthinobacterium agaricidamnosum]CDG81362.1 sodium/hydrogen exchanger family protein [Janthinobacterium agaricidamnosum NBRC 102515 = DSM 9628]